MKRLLVVSLLGIAASIASVNDAGATGSIYFDTYLTGYCYVSYNGIKVGSDFHATLYYSLGNQLGSILPDPTHTKNPLTLGGNLAAFNGTYNAYNSGIYPTPFRNDDSVGLFFGPMLLFSEVNEFASGTVTLMIAAFNGATYEASTIRGHSLAWLDTLATGLQLGSSILTSGDFEVFFVPEPSTYALGGLSLGSLWLFRRRK